MNQSLHIFRKDLRHHWADLLLYGVVLVSFVVVTQQSWSSDITSTPFLSIFEGLLKFILPITWMVIFARLLHEESLVGDQQFWVTRPYRWPSLLGAKLLFVVVCVVLPFVVMQCVLLWLANLSPLQAMPALLLNLLYVTLLFWLPFLAVSAVTSTVPRAFMTLIGAFLVLGVLLAVFARHSGLRMFPPYLGWTLAVLFGVPLLGVLLYQYATRETGRARYGLAAAAIVPFFLLCGAAVAPILGPQNALMKLRYPAQASGTSKLTFDADARNYREDSTDEAGRKSAKVSLVTIPVRLEGLSAGERLEDEGMRYTLDTEGYHFASPWNTTALSERGLWVTLPNEVYQHVFGHEARMHLTVAARILKPDAPEVVTAADQFPAPAHGVCALEQGVASKCRNAFDQEVPMQIDDQVTLGPCGEGQVVPEQVFQQHAGGGVSFDPVSFWPVPLRGRVCPGTTMTFVAYHPGERFRTELEIPAIDLQNYPSAFSGGGASSVKVTGRVEKR